ncbi:DUF6794 domain-containing protein [Singulisphaera rosea]
MDEAVERVLGCLSGRDRLILRDTHEDNLAARFHFGPGMSIRHEFGLWRGNNRLMASCGETNADDVAGSIIHAAWRRIQPLDMTRAVPPHFVPRDALTRYLLQHYRHLLSADELELLNHEGWFTVGGPDDPDRLGVARLSAPPALRERVGRGLRALYEELVERMLREHSAEIIINRCPSCKQVCRTPKARQCWECGHDWHAAGIA